MVMKFNIIDLRHTHEVNEYENKYEDEDVENCSTSSDSEETMDEKFVIHAFGRTAKHKSVFCKIIGYTPNFFIEIPSDGFVAWNHHHVTRFVESLKAKVEKEYRNGLIHHDVVTRHKFYGFTAGKDFHFIRLVFSNYTAFNKYRYTCNRPLPMPTNGSLCKVNLYEANIDPMIRCMHVMNVDPVGWIKVHRKDYTLVTKESEKESTCDIEMVVHWTKVENANIDSIARLVVCSFDIECNSIDGSFPQASRIGDKIIQIGSTFSYYGESECFYKNIITLGSCTDIPGAQVEQYNTEKEVLMAWKRLIKRMHPDIMTGYNIFGFDFKYIYERYETIHCPGDFLDMSKLKDHRCELKTKSLSSSAYGVNEFKYFDIPGIVMIDLFKVIQREYNLSSYKLDNVISHFINETITIQNSSDDAKHKSQKQSSDVNDTNDKLNDDDIIFDSLETSTFNTSSTDGLYEGNYCGIMVCDQLGTEMFENGKKFKIVSLTDSTITINENVTLDHFNKHRWCLVKDDVKPHEIFKLQKGSADDRRVIAEYCLQDCAHCNRLMNKLEIITNNVSMANVSSIPFEMIFLRGQGVKAFSLVAKQCRLQKYLIPVIKYDEDVDNWFEGARVIEPEVKVHMTPIAVLDFGSLYPSVIQEINGSHEMLVTDERYDNLPNYTYNDIEYMDQHGNVIKHRFAKQGDKLAIIPEILRGLLTERKKAKQMMKKEKDPFKQNLWNAKQLALKVTANSMYGQIGAATSPIYMKAIAASTTAVGRKRLDHAKTTVESHYPNARIVYGDTDSIFIDFGLADTEKTIGKEKLIKKCIELGKEASDVVNNQLPWPQCLEYEKTFYPFIILSKKRYVGNKYEEDETHFKQTSMGIVLKRRDNAKIVKYVYNGLIDIILNKRDIGEILKFTKTTLQNILNGQFPMKYFEVTKTLGANYKDRSSIAHAVLADRMAQRDPGNTPQINDRIPYVAIVTKECKGKRILQGDRIEHPEYIVQKNLKIDYLFYIEKQIKNPCIQLLDLVTDQAGELFSQIINAERSRRDGLVPLTNYFGKVNHEPCDRLFSTMQSKQTNADAPQQPAVPITNWFKRMTMAKK